MWRRLVLTLFLVPHGIVFRFLEPQSWPAPVTLGGAPLLPRRLELRLEETGRNRDLVAARYSVVRG